ncbi:MAG TPA: hypothetical protein VF681_14695 [Abditibacteriaceae bacterium]|jgi:hypothetical protein
MGMEICAQHKDELEAALAMRDLTRFNITNAQSREDAHLAQVESMGEMSVVDPIRTAQALILQAAIRIRPDLVLTMEMHCPCCAARDDFHKARAMHEDMDPDAMPWDQNLIVRAAQAIDEDLKARGLK